MVAPPPPKTLTDNEILMGLEARSRELWEEQWSSGLPVHVAVASLALVHGCDEFTWQHRMVVEYAATGGWRYFYRPTAFTMPTPCENRAEALAAIETFRPKVPA